MRASILAAGYGTRLYPVSENTPKALLPVAGRLAIDYLMDRIREARTIREICLVTNHRFFAQFQQWQEQSPRDPQGGVSPRDICLIDDGTMCNEERLGGVRDLQLALETVGMDEDYLVLGSDNVFCFSFRALLDFFEEKGTDCITIHVQPDIARLQRTGVIEVDETTMRALRFEEKPAQPRSRYASPPVYVLRKDTLPLIQEYLDSGGNPDGLGYFVQWLIPRKTVHTFLFHEPRYDIGDQETYREVCRVFETARSATLQPG